MFAMWGPPQFRVITMGATLALENERDTNNAAWKSPGLKGSQR